MSQMFKEWCHQNGYREFNSGTFYKRMEALNFHLGNKDNSRVIFGIKFKDNDNRQGTF